MQAKPPSKRGKYRLQAFAFVARRNKVGERAHSMSTVRRNADGHAEWIKHTRQVIFLPYWTNIIQR
jgi:hypothetical protein